MTPLSDSEAATVQRFENAEPAPESWGGGLREALAAGSKLPWSLLGGTHDRVVIDDHGCHVATTGTFPDAALIVAAVNALPEIAALRAKADAADRVREMHVSDGHGWCRYCGQITEGDLHEAGWPCRTIRALDGPSC